MQQTSPRTLQGSMSPNGPLPPQQLLSGRPVPLLSGVPSSNSVQQIQLQSAVNEVTRMSSAASQSALVSPLLSTVNVPPLATDNLQMPYSPAEVPTPQIPPPPQSPQMVTPQSVDQQRQGYAAQLAANLKQASLDIARQVQIEKQELAQRAALEKANYDVMVDQFVRQQALAMDNQTNLEICRLQQSAVGEKSKLEQQAVALKMEYENKKAEEDMYQRRFLIETEFLEQNAPLATTAQKLSASMAAHGMQPTTKLPQIPVVPHLCPVPGVLQDYWARFGYAAPSLVVPMG